jgi:hypothetical protein
MQYQIDKNIKTHVPINLPQTYTEGARDGGAAHDAGECNLAGPEWARAKSA